MRRGPRASLYRDWGGNAFPRRSEGGSVRSNEGASRQARRARRQPLAAGLCRRPAARARPQGEVRPRERKSSVNCVCCIKEYFLSLHPLVSGVIFSQLRAGPGPGSPALRPLHPEQQARLRVTSLSPTQKPRCCCVAFRPEARLLPQDVRRGRPRLAVPPCSSPRESPAQARLVAAPETRCTSPRAFARTCCPERPSSPPIAEPQPRSAPGPAALPPRACSVAAVCPQTAVRGSCLAGAAADTGLGFPRVCSVQVFAR